MLNPKPYEGLWLSAVVVFAGVLGQTFYRKEWGRDAKSERSAAVIGDKQRLGKQRDLLGMAEMVASGSGLPWWLYGGYTTVFIVAVFLVVRCKRKRADDDPAAHSTDRIEPVARQARLRDVNFTNEIRSYVRNLTRFLISVRALKGMDTLRDVPIEYKKLTPRKHNGQESWEFAASAQVCAHSPRSSALARLDMWCCADGPRIRPQLFRTCPDQHRNTARA